MKKKNKLDDQSGVWGASLCRTFAQRSLSTGLKTPTDKSYWQFQNIGWPALIKFLIVASIVTILGPWAIYGILLIVPTGEAGWGYAFLLIALWAIGYAVAIVNVVAALAYLFTHKLSSKAILLDAAAIALSAVYLVAIWYPRLFR